MGDKRYRVVTYTDGSQEKLYDDGTTAPLEAAPTPRSTEDPGILDVIKSRVGTIDDQLLKSFGGAGEFNRSKGPSLLQTIGSLTNQAKGGREGGLPDLSKPLFDYNQIIQDADQEISRVQQEVPAEGILEKGAEIAVGMIPTAASALATRGRGLLPYTFLSETGNKFSEYATNPEVDTPEELEAARRGSVLTGAVNTATAKVIPKAGRSVLGNISKDAIFGASTAPAEVGAEYLSDYLTLGETRGNYLRDTAQRAAVQGIMSAAVQTSEATKARVGRALTRYKNKKIVRPDYDIELPKIDKVLKLEEKILAEEGQAPVEKAKVYPPEEFSLDAAMETLDYDVPLKDADVTAKPEIETDVDIDSTKTLPQPIHQKEVKPKADVDAKVKDSFEIEDFEEGLDKIPQLYDEFVKSKQQKAKDFVEKEGGFTTLLKKTTEKIDSLGKPKSWQKQPQVQKDFEGWRKVISEHFTTLDGHAKKYPERAAKFNSEVKKAVEKGSYFMEQSYDKVRSLLELSEAESENLSKFAHSLRRLRGRRIINNDAVLNKFLNKKEVRALRDLDSLFRSHIPIVENILQTRNPYDARAEPAKHLEYRAQVEERVANISNNFFVPFIREGDYVVRVKGKNRQGNRVDRYLTEKEAKKAARQAEKEFGAENVTAFKDEAKTQNLNSTEILDKEVYGFFEHLEPARLVKGERVDVVKNAIDYVERLAKLTTRLESEPVLRDVIRENQSSGARGLAEYQEKVLNDVYNPKTWNTFKKLASVKALGLNPRMFVLQAYQTMAVALPEATSYVGNTKGLANFNKAWGQTLQYVGTDQQVRRFKKGKLQVDKDMQKAFRLAEKSGILADSQVRAESGLRESANSEGRLDSEVAGGLSLMQASERINRLQGFALGYYTAESMGVKNLKQRYEFAREFTKRVNFDYSRYQKLPVFRGNKFGDAAGIFRTYPVEFLRLLKDNAKTKGRRSQAFKMGLAGLALGGVRGIPMAQTLIGAASIALEVDPTGELDKLLNSAGDKVIDAFEPSDENEKLAKETKQTIIDSMLRGVTSQALGEFSFSLGGALAVDLVADSSRGNVTEAAIRTIVGYPASLTFDTVKQVLFAYNEAPSISKKARMIEPILPAGMAQALKTYRANLEGGYYTNAGNPIMTELTMPESMVYGMGLIPERMEVARRESQKEYAQQALITKYRNDEHWNRKVGNEIKHLLKARNRGDIKAAERILKRVQRYAVEAKQADLYVKEKLGVPLDSEPIIKLNPDSIILRVLDSEDSVFGKLRRAPVAQRPQILRDWLEKQKKLYRANPNAMSSIEQIQKRLVVTPRKRPREPLPELQEWDEVPQ